MFTLTRPGRIAVLACAATAAIATAAPAMAATHSPHTSSHASRLTVTWRQTGFSTQDTGAMGPSSGDTLQATFRVTSQPGTSAYACTLAGTQYVCTGVVHLRGGDLYVAVAPAHDSDPAAVTGGTGIYRGVTGQYTQIEKTAKNGSWTFSLLYR